MAKLGFFLALLFVGGLALPASKDIAGFSEDMSIFFDHTVTGSESRIVGGTLAAEGAYPWMVAMTSGTFFRSFMCGGSVITNRHVLTAAHCIQGALVGIWLTSSLRVTVGTNQWNSGGQTYALQGFRNHELYDRETIKNDIGILITSSNIVFNNRVAPITLDINFIPGYAATRVSGWGRIVTGGAISANLLELEAVTVEGERCVTEVAAMSAILGIRAPPVDPTIEICTFVAPNRGMCNGDSGSALIIPRNNNQVGIVSWGLPCARGAPDMFVRVSAYISWVQDVIGTNVIDN